MVSHYFIKGVLLIVFLFKGIGYGISQCDPSTIDPCEIGKNSIIQASYHAQIIKTSNGYSITGQNFAPDGFNFQVVLTNIPGPVYPMPAGIIPVWGAIGGRAQAVFIGSDSKIYAIGRQDLLIDGSNTNSTAWGEATLSLPSGITVCEINKWEGSAGSGNDTGNATGSLNGFLAFSTFSGEMYITGAGASEIQLNASNSDWTRIEMPFGINIVDFAVGYRTLLILGSDGKLYASGPNTYLGNGSSQNLNTITVLTQPNISVNGITQIEAGFNSFLILDGDGTIHVLGENSEGSLGVGHTNDVDVWSKVGMGCAGGILRNVAYISTLSSHDYRSASSAILVDETIRSWGMNDNQSITSGNERIVPCHIRPSGTNFSAVAVSNGGHITPYVNKVIQICNIGHNREGAFGDGNDESGDYGEYACFIIPGFPEICGTKEVDLELQKTATNNKLEIGDSIVFTITIINNGPGNSTGSSVRDQLPSGFSYISDDSEGAYNSSSGLWIVGPLDDGESISLNITAKIRSTGDYTNYAQILSDNEVDPDSTPGDMSTEQDDDASVTVPVIPCPSDATCLILAEISINDCFKLVPSNYNAGNSNAEIEDIFKDIITCGVVGIYHSDDFTFVDDCSSITRTYWLTDDGKEVMSCIRDFIFVADNIGPFINCPSDVIFTCGDEMPASETFLEGNDNCSSASSFPVIEFSDVSLTSDFCLINDGIFERKYTVNDDCSNTSSCIQIITFKPEFYIPNIFSPSGNGNNKHWTVFNTTSVKIKECNIYDRWGNLVFGSKTEQPKWDGKINGVNCAQGVYVYLIYYADSKGMDQIKIGELTLLN
jgi:gliding motility-associated-like protein/uncharacterized repeat protein (TIGR01451 family)